MAGSNPAMIVRVAATIEELKKNLAEGRSNIETTTAAMQKMAASFSGDKLIQAAQNTVAAVNAIGGASKLTEAEQARVNATLDKALEKYRVLGREAPAGMQDLADATRKVNALTDEQAGRFTVSAAEMKKLGVETQTVDKAHVGLTDTVKQLALGFAGMFTARAAFNFVKDTIEEASALKDLSQQTHINVEELQLMAGGMSEFGVDADTLGKGLYKLSRGIAGGDESVTHGLAMMGLSLKDVEGLNGQALFLKIENGLATLQGGLRDTAAADLFGGKLGAAMAGASEGIEGAMETWRRMNHVASAESVDAMDQFGESITRANKNVSAIAANMIGPLAQGFNVIFDAAARGASKWDIAMSLLPKGLGLVGTGADHLAQIIDDLNQQTDKNTASTGANTAGHQTGAAAIDQRSQAAKFMATLEANAAVTLSAAQITDLEHLKEIGQLNAKNAEGIGITTAQYNKYVASVEAAKKAAADLKEAHAQADQIILATYKTQLAALQAIETQRAKSYGTQAQLAMLDAQDAAEQRLAKSVYLQLNSETERMKVILDAGKQHEAITLKKMALEQQLLAITNSAVVAELNAREQLNAAYGLDVQGHVKVTSAAETLRLKLEELHRTKQAGIDQTAQEQVLTDAYTKALYDEAVAQDRANAAAGATSAAVATGAQQIKQASTDAAASSGDAYRSSFGASAAAFEQFKGIVVAGTHAMSDAMTGVTDAGSWSERNFQMQQAQRDRGEIFLTGMGGGMPTRDSGGPGVPGRPYAIGRPEVYIPERSGTFVPLGGASVGGSVTMHNTFNINGSIRELAQPLVDEITRMMHQSRQWPSA